MPPTTTVRVSDTEIGDPRSAFILAEMAWAHDGQRDLALAIVEGAADAGADAINIHLTDLPSYMVRDYGSGPGRVSAGKDTKPIFDYLTEIALSPTDWEHVAARAHERGLALSTMCNDPRSLELADRLKPDLHLIAPGVIGDRDFIGTIASRGLPVIVSIGGSSLAEIEATIALCREAGAGGVIIQYGYQAYPTQPGDLDLGAIARLRDTFDCPVGYHDHTDADAPAAFGLPLAALGAGASVLEKHMTHDRGMRGEDFESAFSPSDMRRFVEMVRACAPALGSGAWRPLNDTERAYRKVVRKRMVATIDLATGAVIDRTLVAFKRSDAGLEAGDLELVIGRALRHARKADDPIDWADLA